MLKTLTVSNAYVVAALQRALQIEFSAGRCPTIDKISIVPAARDDQREVVIRFAQDAPPVGGAAEPPPGRAGRAARRFDEAVEAVGG